MQSKSSFQSVKIMDFVLCQRVLLKNDSDSSVDHWVSEKLGDFRMQAEHFIYLRLTI